MYIYLKIIKCFKPTQSSEDEIKDSLFIFAIIYKIKARMIVSYKVQSYKR